MFQIEEADNLRNLEILLGRGRAHIPSDDWPRVRLTLRVLFEMATRGVEAAVQVGGQEGDEMLSELEAIVRVTWTERIEPNSNKP